MCTLIALHRCVPGRPLMIAANRDEFLARPAEGPAIRMRESGPVLAPLDLEAGGSWLGLNAHGVFVGLTNLRPAVAGGADLAMGGAVAGIPGASSRGEVVMTALDARNASDAAARVAQLEANKFNPFQLLVADSRHAMLTVYRDRPRTRALEPGVHIVGNVEDDAESHANELGNENVGAVIGTATSKTKSAPTLPAQMDSEEPRARKLARIRERVEKLVMERNRDLLADLGEVCREHVDADPFESTCVHVADRYGTRSSLLLELAEEPQMSRLWATDGPPCERSFENLSALLEQLDEESRSFR